MGSRARPGVQVYDENGERQTMYNPTREFLEQKVPTNEGEGTPTAPGARPRVLVYLPTNQVISSYTELEPLLSQLGWSRRDNPRQPDLLQFYKSQDSTYLISLPTDFAKLRSFHMYDIVVQNRSYFEVRSP